MGMELVYDAHANREEMTSAAKSVSNDYSHFAKVVIPGDPIRIDRTMLKWYSIARAEDGVPAEIERQARGFLENISDEEKTNLGDLGFVILHRCGNEFYFLLLQTWRNNNELWESVYARHSDAEPDFTKFEFTGNHRGTFCVWEMAAVVYEMQAWRRFLHSPREPADISRYLDERFSGEC